MRRQVSKPQLPKGRPTMVDWSVYMQVEKRFPLTPLDAYHSRDPRSVHIVKEIAKNHTTDHKAKSDLAQALYLAGKEKIATVKTTLLVPTALCIVSTVAICASFLFPTPITPLFAMGLAGAGLGLVYGNYLLLVARSVVKKNAKRAYDLLMDESIQFDKKATSFLVSTMVGEYDPVGAFLFGPCSRKMARDVVDRGPEMSTAAETLLSHIAYK